jgi:hypothetical protein
MQTNWFDSFSIPTLFGASLILMLLMLEIGFRLGRSRRDKKVKAQTAQVRALMGATLGLLAFMLAFTFASAQNHFEQRIQLQIDEAMLSKKAFMRADLATEPARSELRALLLEYSELRVNLKQMVRRGDSEQAAREVQRSEGIQLALWATAGDESMSPSSFGPEGIADMVLELMAMQSQRLHAALVNRIPFVIWITLYFTATMAMIVVGYQAGLTERRSPVATFSLALAFAAVMVLIMDLDRPLQSLFEIDISIWEQTVSFMRRQL